MEAFDHTSNTTKNAGGSVRDNSQTAYGKGKATAMDIWSLSGLLIPALAVGGIALLAIASRK